MAQAPSTQLTGLQWRADGGVNTVTREAPDEVVVGVSYDSEPYAVLMATPADLKDLAIGFTVSERLARFADVLDVRVSEREVGFVADILLTREGRQRIGARRKRMIESRSSCGLCGVEHPRDALRELATLPNSFVLSHESVQRALGQLQAQQALGRATRAVHAAGWADRSGEILLIREDVGRHNALDKLIGAAMAAGHDPAAAMVIVTSRCSYEMVEKTVTAGVEVLAAISAPTVLAVRMADAANLTLIALLRDDGHTVFSAPARLNPASRTPDTEGNRCLKI
jgi:FdhD protein